MKTVSKKTMKRIAIASRGLSKRIYVAGACFRSPHGSKVISKNAHVVVQLSPRGGSIVVKAGNRQEVWHRITLRA